MVRRIAIAAAVVAAMTTGALAQTTKGLQAELVAQIKDAEEKLVALAETMTQEQYSWRPMEGVRSVGEVYMHAAVGNLSIPGMIGVEPPMKIERGMEKSVTEKAKIVEMLKMSFRHVEDAVSKVPDADLGKATKIFGQDGTYRGVLLLLATHAHEHLGQSIAYARMNKVVPPWSKGGM